MKPLRKGLLLTLVAAFALIGAAIAGPGLAVAQDASPVAGAGEHNHPAHIHTGTCDAVGEVVYPLNNVTDADASMDAGMDDMASPEAGGMDTAASPETGEDTDMHGHDAAGGVVAESTTTVTTTFDELTGAEHVINVHESEENIGNYIACGEITGTAENGTLTVTLNELNDSGWEGDAELTDNGDGTIEVTIHLTAVDMAGGMASPEAEASPEA